MIPMSNVFYCYQQNNVDGDSFNIRTRSLNGALYWFAQIFGGLIIGLVLDMPKVSPLVRAKSGWALLVVTGIAIWGGGYAFQKWEYGRLAIGLKQDIDFTDSSISVGPIFLYIFYGMYDALWKWCCYWIMGTTSNFAAVTAILVAASRTFSR